MNAAETLRALDQYAFIILPALLAAEQFGIPLPAVPALLGFGALAAHGRGNIPLMLSMLAAVALIVDFAWYELGRRRGAQILRGLGRLSQEADFWVRRAEKAFARYGARGMLVAKFVPGLTTVAAQNLEEARRGAGLVIADGHRAAEIIGRIRNLAKKAPLQKDWLDINDTIRDVLTLVRSEVQAHRVSLQTQLAGDVPLILGDRIQVQQVLLNLMMNAIEAMRGAGEGPRELWVSSKKTESPDVLIAVRDSGPGLDPKSLDRLFDAFYTTKPHGLGMGLAISRSIVEAHGGRLWATANAPHGAVFQFTLPTDGEKV